jgi:type 2 lantibiotic biosynthesis protein LanM
MITKSELRHIAAQSLTLRERLEAAKERRLHTFAVERANKWKQQWQKQLKDSDGRHLERRLTWSGFAIEQMESALGAVKPEELIETLPSWLVLLDKSLAVLQQRACRPDFFDWVRSQPFIVQDDALPYEDLFAPLVHQALNRLTSDCAGVIDRITPRARADLGRALLSALCSHTHQCLELEFSVFRAATQSSLFRLAQNTSSKTGDKLYRRFVRELATGGIVRFYSEYAVLARQIGMTIERWLTTTTEFLLRLERDWALIENEFLTDGDLQVEAIETNLSDLHHGGRAVHALHFRSGRRVIYKPKDVGVERAYFDLLAWLNPYVSLPFKVLKIAPRPNYGWVEAAEHLSCPSEGGAHRYYRRAGMLLCLSYLLEATDCLFENVVASGEYPVLIDLETVMHQQYHREYWAAKGDSAKLQDFAQDLLRNSVMRTGMLPSWHIGEDGSAYIGSGLGMVSEQPTGGRRLQSCNVNNDRMGIFLQPVRLQPGKNLVHLNGRGLALSTYTEDVVAGFRELYDLLLKKRALLAGETTPLCHLMQQQVRFLHRNTREYAVPLILASQPKYMRSGISRSLLFEKLLAPYLHLPARPRSWSLAESEVQDLEVGDIPRFTTCADGRDLALPNGETIPEFFSRSARELVLERLHALSAADLEMQIGFTRASIAAHALGDKSRIDESSLTLSSNQNEPDPEAALLPPEEFLTEAKHLAAQIAEKAILMPDGSATWVVLGYDPDTERYQLQPIGYDIYNGRCGIALFLAALAALTGDEDAARLAKAAVRPIVQQLQTAAGTAYLASMMNIGGLAGLGSLVYTLAKIGAWFQEPAFIVHAGQAAELISTQRIDQDGAYDVMHGAAGALLAFLALHECSGSLVPLRQAEACGERLLATRVQTPAGLFTWPSKPGQFATGFSHGAAGIAYSLLRLYGVTNNQHYRDAAAEAIGFEQAVFDEVNGNWPDFGWSDPPRFMLTWCHGAPGIGLGRAGGLNFLRNAAIDRDLDVALQTTRNVGLSRTDHLCCGNLGRLELYLVASDVCDRPDLYELARKQASAVIMRKRRQGYYGIFPADELLENSFAPAFFRGTAGIGYSLLRLTQPGSLPSPLLMT